jgi:hypothetical protein
LPFDARLLRQAGYDAIRRVLREDDAPKPSTRLSATDNRSATEIATRRRVEREELTRELRRELDWIPLKALRKDRTERYQTPAELARDVRRYLDGEALQAGPESLRYRARKFVRRHRAPVVGATAVFLALTLGLAGTLWMADNARKAEAEQRRLAIDESKARGLADEKTAEAIKARRVADEKTAEAINARDVIENNSYVANVEMAAAAMDFRQFDRLRPRLGACPERLRGWEWRWLNASADQSLVELKGQTRPVSARGQYFSSDGSRCVMELFQTVWVVDAEKQRRLVGLQGHTKGITCGGFSLDGTRIVTAGSESGRTQRACHGRHLSRLQPRWHKDPYGIGRLHRAVLGQRAVSRAVSGHPTRPRGRGEDGPTSEPAPDGWRPDRKGGGRDPGGRRGNAGGTHRCDDPAPARSRFQECTNRTVVLD